MCLLQQVSKQKLQQAEQRYICLRQKSAYFRQLPQTRLLYFQYQQLVILKNEEGNFDAKILPD